MLEKLLSLLLHAKSGAVATVLVVGTSGALVTATVNDGVTTITLNQPSENATSGSTTTTMNTTIEQAILALFNRTSAEDDPTSTATAKGCSDEAHARNKELKRVNDASHENRDDVKALGRAADGTDAKALVKDADAELRDIRQLAVKAIHATFDCDPHEDEDADEDADDEDEDENEGEGTSTTTSTTTTTVTSLDFAGDATAIADLAIALMEEVVAKLESDLAELDSDEETTNATTNENGRSDKKDNKGKGNSGNGKGRSR